MKRFNKLLCFVLVFISVMAAFCTVSFAAQQIDLSKCANVQLNYLDTTEPDANWKLDSSNTSVTQTTNSKPAIFLSDINYVNKRIDGTFSVGSNEDDDFIGFVFGYKDKGHYYLFDWKRAYQNYKDFGVADIGMSVKVVNTDSSLSGKDLWQTSGTDKVEVLYHNKIGYVSKTDYQFTLNFTDQGAFNIVIKQGNKVLDNISINDSTYTSGKFGFYNFSQPMVTYKGFTFEAISPMLEVVSIGDSKVSLAWDTVDGATSYILKRSTISGGPYETITTTSAITYTDTDVTNGATYYYVVSAINAGGESPNSNEVSATPTAPQHTNKLKLVLEVNQEKQLSVSEELSDNNEMDWISSDISIATVDTNGMVKALKPGNTVITCTSKDKSYTESINVLVVDLEYQLAVDLSIGDTCRLTIDDLKNTTYVTWSSYDPTIATVSTKGKVSAIREGLTYITATDKDGTEIGRIYIRVRQ